MAENGGLIGFDYSAGRAEAERPLALRDQQPRHVLSSPRGRSPPTTRFPRVGSVLGTCVGELSTLGVKNPPSQPASTSELAPGPRGAHLTINPDEDHQPQDHRNS